MEGKRKGRKSKNSKVLIEDPLIEPFYIYVEEKCYTIFKRGEINMRGNYSQLQTALERIIKFQLAMPGKSNSYTIQEYINSFDNSINKILTTIKL